MNLTLPFTSWTLLVERQEGHPACKKAGCWFVGIDALSGALHVLLIAEGKSVKFHRLLTPNSSVVMSCPTLSQTTKDSLWRDAKRLVSYLTLVPLDTGTPSFQCFGPVGWTTGRASGM